jgi:hypothetical protein
MRHIALKSIILGALALGTTACASFKLDEAPSGFAVVSSYESTSGYMRAKARDNVGLNIVTFHNVEGGTLAYWSGDLVEKLGRRGYQIVDQSPVRAKNGVVGTRFDFRYTPPAEEQEKFYTVVLYVSDEYRVVAQMGGNWEHRDDHGPHIQEVARDIKIKGCKVASKICKGAQPPALTTPSPTEPAKPSPGDEEERPPVEPQPADAESSESGQPSEAAEPAPEN